MLIILSGHLRSPLTSLLTTESNASADPEQTLPRLSTSSGAHARAPHHERSSSVFETHPVHATHRNGLRTKGSGGSSAEPPPSEATDGIPDRVHLSRLVSRLHLLHLSSPAEFLGCASETRLGNRALEILTSPFTSATVTKTTPASDSACHFAKRRQWLSLLPNTAEQQEQDTTL